MTPPDMDHPNTDQIAQSLEAFGMPFASELARLAQPAFWLQATNSPIHDLAIGASRLGGAPDLPAGFTWPTNLEKPLTFLAQINLSDIKVKLLPASGWLLFFLDERNLPWEPSPPDSGTFRVMYLPGDAGPLKRAVHPDVDIPESRPSGGNHCRKVTARSGLSLPCIGDAMVEPWFGDVHSSDFDDEDWFAPYQLERLRLLGVPVNVDEDSPSDFDGIHQLLGHPALMQNDLRGPLSEAVANANGSIGLIGRLLGKLKGAGGTTKPEDWQLLLQLDSEDQYTEVDGKLVPTGAWCWVDMGHLYWLISAEDLAANRFDRCWMMMDFG